MQKKNFRFEGVFSCEKKTVSTLYTWINKVSSKWNLLPDYNEKQD